MRRLLTESSMWQVRDCRDLTLGGGELDTSRDKPELCSWKVNGQRGQGFAEQWTHYDFLSKMEGWVEEKCCPSHQAAFHSLNKLSLGSTQTRHIPEESPSGFHLQSVSKLLLVISFV